MYQYKNLLASKTVWGGAIAVLAGLAGFMGYVIEPSDVASITTLLDSFFATMGGAIAIFGRIHATKKIG